MADEIVGISNHTLDTFLGGRARDPRCHVIHNYGVDPSCFITPEPDKKLFRREIGVPENALILLFGGRVVPEKNPAFVIDVLSELRKLDGRAVAVFAGAGSLENAVRERAKALGVHEHIRMLGWRRDLPNIMRCAEWFILPRPEQPMEGFGLAVVEAQLAGLRILVSRGVPEDPFLPTASFQRLSLSDSPSKWAQAAIKQLLLSKPSAAAALIALGNSPMDMDAALRHLLSLYE
jgi:glycosyltransferase involved in cell wall biosynthesis